MARLRYASEDDDGLGEGTNDAFFHDVESGEFVAPGETLEVPDDAVDEYLNHDIATFERAEDTAESADVDATEADDGQQSTDDTAAEVETDQAPFDPDDYSVADLREELDRRDLSNEELDALEDAERSDPDPRSTALDAIDAQRSGGE